MRDIRLHPGATVEKDVILRAIEAQSGIDVFLKPGWIVDNDVMLVAERYFPGSFQTAEDPPGPASSGGSRMLMGVGV